MPSNTHPLRNASLVAARFGSDYGYRFDGDNVTLHASVQLVHFLEQEVQWLLQLQASPINAASTKTPFTHVIAEVVLPPLSDLTSSGEVCSIVSLALPPAGQGEFKLSLALVARQAEKTDELHDIVFFSRPERFLQPRLVGSITCNLAQNEVTLSIERIENPRDLSNVSGTLSLELWALNAPYEGGSFKGQPLAGVVLGRLTGQESWGEVTHTLHYAPPTAGCWQVAVMLREWTGSSYTTRDFFNLSEPLLVAAEVIVPPPQENIEPPITPKAVPPATTAVTVVKSKPAKKSPTAAKPTKTTRSSKPGR